MHTLLARLADGEQRGEAARALARHLGADDLLFFTVDPQSGALLPAPGSPQTVPEGNAWRGFLDACRDRGEATAELPSPFASGRHRAHGMSAGRDGVIVLIGGSAGRPELGPELRALLPLLTAVFHADRLVHSAQGEARIALDAATRAGALADALDGARRSLAAVNVALQAEVAERRRAEAALADADRRKDEFLATLAHELRNPLAPLRNCIQVLRIQLPPGPGAPGIVDMMERQVEQLVRLVDDLMDVARITRGRIELRCEHVDLRMVIERAVETSRPAIDALGHTLVVSIPSQPVMLDADPIRLAQALANLLHNAAKYTAPGGRIDLVVAPEAPDIEIRIRDSGIGIPADMLSRIFDPFTQVESSLDRSHGGLGIGLMLVRQLIEMHRGRVTAHSDGASRGSTFIVRLPMLSDAAVGRADSPASPAGARELTD